MSVVINTTPPTTTTIHSLGYHPVQFPRIPETKSQGPDNTESNASKRPPAFDLAANTSSPRKACDHEVVIPHDGQRIPNTLEKVHGGKPSCWWVPKPRESGSNQHATPSNSNSPLPVRQHSARCGTVKGKTDFVEIEITGLKPGREDSGQPGKTQDRFSNSHQDASCGDYAHSCAASSVTARRSIESAEPDAGSTSTMVPWSRTSSLATSNGVGQNWMVVSTTRSMRRPRMLA